jgi:hypothetical protein
MKAKSIKALIQFYEDSGKDEISRDARRKLKALLAEEKALIDLFQACSELCLEDMDKLEAKINAASAAIGKAEQAGQG